MAKSKKQIVVIGLGRFGTSLVKALYDEGADILAIDDDQERINAVDSFCTHAVCGDATDERVLKRLGISNFDIAVVCMSTDIESSIFVTLMCKQLGVKQVIAKAKDDRHRHVLERIGADRVIIPEEEMGEKLAATITKPNMVEIMSVNDKFRVVEIITPIKWQNKSLIQLDLRKAEKVSIILIRRGEDVIVTPGGDCVLMPDDILVIAGATVDTERLSKKASKSVIETVEAIEEAIEDANED